MFIIIPSIEPSIGGIVIFQTASKKNKDGMALVAQMVAAEYAGWDGRSSEEIRTGIHHPEPMTLQIALSDEGFECTLYPRAQSRNGRSFPEGVYKNQSRSIKLQYDPYLLEWFSALPNVPFLQQLFTEQSIQLHHGKQYRQQFTLAPIMLFHDDPDGELFGYVHHPKHPILHQTYQLMCHKRLQEQVIS